MNALVNPTAPTVLATAEPLRRYVASLVRDPHEVDDVVQETLTRMLARSERLEESAATGYAFVVARNLVRSGYRGQVRQRDHLHLLVDEELVERPDELAVRREERAALHQALTQLEPDQRRELLEHVVADQPLAALAGDGGEGAVAARLARTRAKVRVDYLVSLRRVDLPSRRCRPVLLSLSSGDRRRQKVLRSGNHLVACEVCADLAPPLLERRRALAGFLPLPLVALQGRLAGLVRSHPLASGGVAAGSVAAAVVVVVAVLAGGSTPPPADSAPLPRSDLSDARGALLPRRADLAGSLGSSVRARGVPVLAVPADEGFWVGHGTARLWVQLTGEGESRRRVRVGDLVSFAGTVVRHGPGFAHRVGVSRGEGARELTRQRFHLAVPAGDVRAGPATADD